jgi:hypothetical protein
MALRRSCLRRGAVPPISRHIDVGLFLERPLEDLIVALERSRLRHSITVLSLSLRIDVGPVLEQSLDDLVVALIRSRLQRRAVPSSFRSINVGLLFEQPLDDLVVALA